MASKEFPLKIIFKAIDQVTAPLKSIRGAVGNFQNKLGQVGKNFDQGMGKAAKIGMAADAVGQLKDQTMGLLAPAIATGREFEKTMASVAAVSRVQIGSEEFKKLEESARKLGATTSFSASQAAQGMTYLAMAGFDAEKTVAAMPGMLDLAKAGNIDLARAADIASNTLGAFKMEASDMGRVSNAMAAAFTRSNVDIEMLAETFKYVAPVANTAGMSIEDLAAMTGLLGDVGIQGSQAGTALRAGLLRLSKLPKPAAEALGDLNITTMHTSESLAQLSKAGIDTSKMKAGDLRQMSDILEEIRIKTQDMGSGERLEFIGKVFGTEASAAFAELITKADASKKSIRGFSAEISKAVANDEVKGIAETMSQNFDGAMKTMESAREEMQLTVYDVIKPALTEMANAGAKAFSWIGEFAKENPMLTKTIIGVVGAIAALTAVLLPVLLVIAGVTSAVATISAGWGVLVAALAVVKAGIVAFSGGLISAMVPALSAAIAAVWSFTVALLANPMTWVVIGIVALIAGLYLLYKNWDQISEYLMELWETTKTKFSEWTSGLFNYLSELWDKVKNIFSEWGPTILAVLFPFLGIPLLIYQNFDKILDYFRGIWDGIVKIFTEKIAMISNLVPQFVKDMFSGKGTVNVNGGKTLPTGSQVQGGVTNTNVNRSVVDVNFGNVPQNVRVNQSKPTKGVNLSMGYAGARI